MTTTVEYVGNTVTASPHAPVEQPSATIDMLREQIGDQATTIAELRAAAANTDQQLLVAADKHTIAVDRHRADIAAIGERLLDEANSRGWCPEYDTVVDELNEVLAVELPRREVDHDVAVDIRVTVTVGARNTQEAVDRVRGVIDEIEKYIDAIPDCVSDPQSSDEWDVECQ